MFVTLMKIRVELQHMSAITTKIRMEGAQGPSRKPFAETSASNEASVGIPAIVAVLEVLQSLYAIGYRIELLMCILFVIFFWALRRRTKYRVTFPCRRKKSNSKIPATHRSRCNSFTSHWKMYHSALRMLWVLILLEESAAL
eukprot:IDg5598t1